MISDILSETRVGLAHIASLAPSGRGATKTHRTTVLRSILRGVSIRGAKVKLEAVRVGGKYVTSLEAYERFVTACGAGAGLAKAERSLAKVNRDSLAARGRVAKAFGWK